MAIDRSAATLPQFVREVPIGSADDLACEWCGAEPPTRRRVYLVSTTLNRVLREVEAVLCDVCADKVRRDGGFFV